MLVRPDTSRFGTDTLDLSQQIDQVFQLGVQNRRERAAKDLQQAEFQREDKLVSDTQTAIQSVIDNPESLKNLGNLYALNPDLGSKISGLIAAGDEKMLAETNAKAQRSQQFFGNLQNLIGNNESPETIRRFIAGGTEAGVDPETLQGLLGKDLSEVGAIAKSQFALSGGVVKATETLTPFQEAQLNIDQQKVNQGQQRINLDRQKFGAEQRQNEIARQAPQERKTQKDVNGVLRYLDDGSQVFQNVQQAPDPKTQAAAQKEERQKKAVLAGSQRALAQISRARELSSGKGFAGANFGRAGDASEIASPTGSTAEFRRIVRTLKQNIGLDRLIELKANGGTLGALNQAELESLQNSLANLEVSQGQKEFQKNLSIVENHYKSVIQSINAPAEGSDPLGIQSNSQSDPLGLR